MDEARFERVYRANAPSIVRYCTFSTGNAQDGEDIAAEVFSRFMAKGERLGDDAVPLWLFTVARNLCTSHHRSRKRQARLTAQLVETPTAADASAWSDAEAWSYLGCLKERERLVVYLHVVEERPFAEVARLFGKSLSAVKMTYYRALERVRSNVERDAALGSAQLCGGAHDAR